MENNRILLIDDEQHIADVVVYILEENGFKVLTALDGDIGFELFKKEKPDLVILDLMLPGLSGNELFRDMRHIRPDIPVIMLTSRSDEIDRVLGLELGADDYVTKPFSTRELAARVKCVLRRSQGGNAATDSSICSCGPLSVDSKAFSVSCLDKNITVTHAEFKFIECLIRYPAKVFTRDELITYLYGAEHVVTDRSIDAAVKRLRKKFADVCDGLDPIETVHGTGYKLNPRLEK